MEPNNENLTFHDFHPDIIAIMELANGWGGGNNDVFARLLAENGRRT